MQRTSMIEHLSRIRQECNLLIPSLGPFHPKFDHMRDWRGPIWLAVNYMIASGLEACGYQKWADLIHVDSWRLVEKGPILKDGRIK